MTTYLYNRTGKPINKYQDPYNYGIAYLLHKYGYKAKEPTKSLEKNLRFLNKKAEQDILAKTTDADYVFILNNATEPKDKEIELLLDQYQYGSIAIKKELVALYEELGI